VPAGGDVPPAAPAAPPAPAARAASIVLAPAKSAATAEAGRALAGAICDDAVVISLQNGVRNADVLRDALPGKRVLAGMVMYNVARRAPGADHRGTLGPP